MQSDKQYEATQEISKKMSQAFSLIQECVKLADEHGVMFSTPWGGEGGSYMYGMGGDYVPEGYEHSKYYDNTGWNASAYSC